MSSKGNSLAGSKRPLDDVQLPPGKRLRTTDMNLRLGNAVGHFHDGSMWLGSSKYSDLTITCQRSTALTTQYFHVHRVILAQCNYFDEQLDGCKDTEFQRLALDEDDPRALETVLRYLYYPEVGLAATINGTLTHGSTHDLTYLVHLFRLAAKCNLHELLMKVYSMISHGSVPCQSCLTKTEEVTPNKTANKTSQTSEATTGNSSVTTPADEGCIKVTCDARQLAALVPDIQRLPFANGMVIPFRAAIKRLATRIASEFAGWLQIPASPEEQRGPVCSTLQDSPCTAHFLIGLFAKRVEEIKKDLYSSEQDVQELEKRLAKEKAKRKEAHRLLDEAYEQQRG